MQSLVRTPSAAYARVDLDARIEASSGGDLTRICLEEAVAALGQALIALRRKPATFPRDALTRAHGIAVHLARSVAPDSPMHDALVQFYGGLAASLARNMAEPRLEEIAQARVDFQDLLSVAGECRRSV